jgi:hypothetical protein
VRRREFIALIGVAAWPLAARAQPTEKLRTLGVLMTLTADDPEAKARIAAFCRGYKSSAGPTVATYGSLTAGAGAVPTPFASRRENWLHSLLTSF